ncbi:MAG: hypothetical protein KF837_36350 [Labilithrix sp.]|nr:hypothetical protein [Labilithrix sp.]
MKVNREQFLAAALLFASTTGCGKLGDRMKGEFNASKDPVVAPVETDPANPGSAADPAALARGGEVKTSGNKPVAVAPVAAKNGPTTVKAVGPANEGIAPAKEAGWGPSQETATNVAPARELAGGPTAEGPWKPRPGGPAAENVRPARGPAAEGPWRPRPGGGPAAENPRPPRPAPKKA